MNTWEIVFNVNGDPEVAAVYITGYFLVKSEDRDRVVNVDGVEIETQGRILSIERLGDQE